MGGCGPGHFGPAGGTISFTSKANLMFLSGFDLRVSMMEMLSSLSPTAMCCPSGLHRMLMFSPGSG